MDIKVSVGKTVDFFNDTGGSDHLRSLLMRAGVGAVTTNYLYLRPIGKKTRRQITIVALRYLCYSDYCVITID